MEHGGTRIASIYCALAAFALAALSSMALLLFYPNTSPLMASQPTAYTDALNRTLGFHRVYVTGGDGANNRSNQTSSRRNVEAISKLLGVELTFVPQTTLRHATELRVQHGYQADIASIVELHTHKEIYADMARNNIQSALILSSSIDVELDLKMRLASIMGGRISDTYDIMFIGRTHTETTEPKVKSTLAMLWQTKGSAEYSASSCQRHWTKKMFLSRRPCAFRTSLPRGTHAYAVSGRMARRLDRRLKRRMASDAHNLDYILADMAMVGLSIAYSASPPPITQFSPDAAHFSQHLSQSALREVSLRSDDPAKYPPYQDWGDVWGDD
ncbi:hypothetical protein GQ54DRAFT_315473 [Martensiomyces pterosporus]|nr:hypothetical protein GQ54DRAFT_315473 [Martensiomyces pterosporus]